MQDEPTRLENKSGARRRNGRSLRAEVLGQNVGGKIFVARRRINERRGVCQNPGQAEGAGGAALLVRIGFGRVAFAIVAGRFHFHFRAAIVFLNFRQERLAWKGGDSE